MNAANARLAKRCDKSAHKEQNAFRSNHASTEINNVNNDVNNFKNFKDYVHGSSIEVAIYNTS